MKVFSLIALLSLISFNAFAADFYECGGFADTPEYRAGINLKTGQAGFFDNDATSDLKLKEVKSLESMPPQTLMVYEGKDAGYNGSLRLEFNLTRLTAVMFSIDSKGQASEIGSAPCRPAQPWE